MNRRRLGVVAAVAGAALSLAACDLLLTEPAAPAPSFTIQFSSHDLPPGGTTTAFGRVSSVALRFVRADSSTRDTVLTVHPTDGTIRVGLALDSNEQISALGIGARLGTGTAPLFEGGAIAAIVAGQPTSVPIPLVPIPAAVVADSAQVTLSSLGGTVPLGATVFYATGDTVTNYPTLWTTTDSSVAVVSPNGIVLPVGVGQTFLEVRADTLVDSVRVDVLPPPVPQTVRWLAAVSGNWSDGTLWSTGTPPLPGDTVVIDAAGTYAINLDVDPAQLAEFTIGGPTGRQAISGTGRNVTSTGNVNVVGGGTMQLTGGTLSLSAGIALADSGSFDAGGVTINTGGAVSATGAAQVALLSSTVNLGGALRVADSSFVEVQGSPVTATGVVIDPLASMRVGQLAAISALVTNQGGLFIDSGTAALTAGLTTTVGSLVRIGGLGTVSRLDLPNGWTSNGQLDLSGDGQLVLATGTLTIPPGGALTTTVGPVTNSAIINAPLDNQGSMSLSESLRLIASGATHTNAGGITLAAGEVFEVQSADAFANNAPLTATDGQVTMTLSGSGAGLTNAAAIAMGNGAFTLTGGPFTQTTGQITGTGVHRFVGLSGSSSTTIQTGVNAGTFLQFESASITAPTILVNSGTQLLLNQSTVGASVTLNGALAVIGPDTSFVTGSVGGNIGSRITIDGGSLGSPTLDVAGGMVNSGLLELLNSQAGASAALNLSGGTLLNDTSGVINILPGAGGGTRRIAAQLTNQGSLLPAADFVLDAPGATHVNAGLIRTDGPFTMQVTGADAFDNSGQLHASTGDIRIAMSGTGAGFRTTGIVTISPSMTLEVSGGPFTQTAGGIGGAGTLLLRSLSANVTPAWTLNTTAPDRVVVEQSTLTIPSVTTVAGTTLTLRSGVLNGALTSGGATTAEGTSSIAGVVTTNASSDITVIGSVLGAADLSIANGFTNDGLISLTNASAGQNARLAIGNGALTLGTGSLVVGQSATGGSYVLAGNLQNTAGTVSLFQSLQVQGQLVDPIGAGPTTYTSNASGILSVTGLNVDGAVFDNVRLQSVGGTLSNFDNVTFQNMDPTARQLSITHPGTALASFTATNLTFSTVPTTGRYISLVDSDGALTAVFTMIVLSSSPLTGSLLSEVLNGAILTW